MHHCKCQPKLEGPRPEACSRQDVIDGVNYENTGELGAEMGGKPVQHGAEVPPNAVRPGLQPTVAAVMLTPDVTATLGALAVPVRAATQSSRDCAQPWQFMHSRQTSGGAMAEHGPSARAKHGPQLPWGFACCRAKPHCMCGSTMHAVGFGSCAGVGHAVGEHHGQGPVHAARG